ncbi:MAG TPA: PAS domain S-box protein [Steroidobacteraceae bacterium]|nr:PAS domain S-box protein [Steroidobacteraceae bacterium]
MIYLLPRLNASIRRSQLGVGLLIAVYVGLSLLMLRFIEHYIPAQISLSLYPLPWLSEGVAVGLIILGGRRLWPAILIGSALTWGAVHGDPASTVLADAIGESLAAVLTVTLLRAWGFRRQLDRVRDVTLLVGAALAARLLAACFDNAGLLLGLLLEPQRMPADYLAQIGWPGMHGPMLTRAFWLSNLHWQLNALGGVLLMVPVLLASPRRARRAAQKRPLALMAALAVTVAWSVASLLASDTWQCWPLLVVALVLVAWTAVEFGMLVAASCTLLLVMVTAAGTCMGLGPLRSAPLESGITATWGFIGVLTGLAPLLSVMLGARSRRERLLAVSAERYRCLFTANPSPLWVTDAVSGRILLANDQAVARYGYSQAELTQMRLQELLTGPALRAESLPRAQLIAEPLQRLRARDGQEREVLLSSVACELEGRQVELHNVLDLTDAQRLRRRLISIADEERQRIAQELHDGLGQSVAGLTIGAEAMLQSAAPWDSPQGRAALSRLVSVARECATSLQQLTAGISALERFEGDLCAALRHLPQTLPVQERTRVAVTIEGRAPIELPIEHLEHLYRVAQEATANALKHSRAEQIHIRLQRREDALLLSIEDNGIGVEAAQRQPTGGLGLTSMHLRAQAIGARLGLESIAGYTRVQLTLPRQGEEPAAPAAAPVHGSGRAPSTPLIARSRPFSLSTLARELLLSLGIALGCFGALAGTHLLMRHASFGDPRMIAPSLGLGLAVAVQLRFGWRPLLGALLGVLLARVWVNDEGWLLAGALAPITFAGCILTATTLRRLGFSSRFDQGRDAILLLLVGAGVWAALTPVLALAAALCSQLESTALPGPLRPALGGWLHELLAGRVSPALILTLTTAWWNALAGVVLVVPTVLSAPSLTRLRRESRRELIAWGLLFGGYCLAASALADAFFLFPLLFAAIVLIVWAAARFGAGLACLATLFASLEVVACMRLGWSPVSALEPALGLRYAWGFVSVLAVTSLFMVALFAEHDARGRRLDSLASFYRQLFRSDPRALWVHDPATGAILETNPRMLASYGYGPEAPPAHVHELLAVPLEAATLSVSGQGVQGPIEGRHRRRWGELFEASLWLATCRAQDQSLVVCFAQDETERNSLRQALIGRTDQERRMLAAHVERLLGPPFGEVVRDAEALASALAGAQQPRAALRALASIASHAAATCRQLAHGLSPMRGDRNDLASALRLLPQLLATGQQRPPQVSVRIAPALELSPREQESLYELAREILTYCMQVTYVAGIQIELSGQSTLVQLRLRLDFAQPGPTPNLVQCGSVALRARISGVRLWQERELGWLHALCELPRMAHPGTPGHGTPGHGTDVAPVAPSLEPAASEQALGLSLPAVSAS